MKDDTLPSMCVVVYFASSLYSHKGKVFFFFLYRFHHVRRFVAIIVCRLLFLLQFFWVTLPSAVHLIICAPTNGGKSKIKKLVVVVFWHRAKKRNLLRSLVSLTIVFGFDSIRLMCKYLSPV